MPSPRTPRPLDHVVLPVPDLAMARARHAALGFTVAPDALHPFGTENACVFFADNSYLEPLAVAGREDCEAAAIAGNVFVARDQAYRFRQGDNGFSAFVAGSSDAAADDAHFRALGMSGGEILEFSRPMRSPDGVESNASFRLAFAADLRSPDFFGFTVQRLNVPAVDRTALTAHDNGVAGIAELVLSEPNPTDFQYFVQELCNNREVDAHSFGMTIELAETRVTVLNPAGMQAWYGRKASTHSRGLRGRAIVYRVGDLAATRSMLEGRGVATRTIAGRLLVDEAPGQGAIYAFEEIR
ncbi:glyoxalase-like protein [Hoeflea marina]|uniref:Glyoxalase-like protein n=1 Tax=Hoeflea marina TaxID=274592 RepID=A0A317PTD0_9HYPH|nr:VOC family protein [Hoeflea marina]PWW03914.1 glyoxalase-like protein [Hoeflea marina]